MARFQIFSSPDGNGYLLDVQCDLVDIMKTRVVVPMLPASETPRAIARLHPSLRVEGEAFVMATHLISAVPSEILRQPRGDLAHHRDEITAALDMLFQGF